MDMADCNPSGADLPRSDGTDEFMNRVEPMNLWIGRNRCTGRGRIYPVLGRIVPRSDGTDEFINRTEPINLWIGRNRWFLVGFLFLFFFPIGRTDETNVTNESVLSDFPIELERWNVRNQWIWRSFSFFFLIGGPPWLLLRRVWKTFSDEFSAEFCEKT